MKKFLLIGLTAYLSVSGLQAARESQKSKPLSGSYPIVLSHGVLGFDDREGLLNGLIQYWGDMDQYLRDQGAIVLTPGKSAMAGVHTRADQQRNLVDYWMASEKFSRVHIIAHSQGGLDSRYMISNHRMFAQVSTLTTVNAVHRGTPVADIALEKIPNWLKPSVAGLLNGLARLLYGEKQDILAMAETLTTTYLSTFNKTTPDHPDVKYFSTGSHIKLPNPIQHPIMFILYPITCLGGMQNGQGCSNDGIVPLSSQKWGQWIGEPDYRGYSTGVDHLQATNFEWTGQLWFDVEGFYLKMAKNALKHQQPE